MSFGNEIKTGNIHENWLFDIYSNNSCLQFDGSDDYVNCGETTSSSPLALTSSTEISVVFWIQFLNDGTGDQVFSVNMPSDNDYAGWWINKNASSNRIQLNWGDNTGGGATDRETMTGSVAMTAGKWYGVAITSNFDKDSASNTKIYTYDESTGAITTNTVTNSGTAGIDTPTYTTGTCYFGRYGSTTNTHYGNFKIKNFGIWSGQLNATNLSSLVQAGRYKNWLNNFGNYTSSSSLIAYWDFSRNSKTVKEYINGQDGTIYGAIMTDFIPVSFSDETDSNVFYKGVILNRPSITENISLISSTSSSSSVSISFPDFKHNGENVSNELYNGDNTYINHHIIVYSKVNGQEKNQIGSFKISNISRDKDRISISTLSPRPWDKVSMPQDQTTSENQYIPVTHGNYTGNTSSTISSPRSNLQSTSKDYKPVNFNKMDSGYAIYTTDTASTGGGRLATYIKDHDFFNPIAGGQANTASVDGANHLQVESNIYNVYKLYPHSSTQTSLSNVTASNVSNIYDGDTDTFASFTGGSMSAGQEHSFDYKLHIDLPRCDNRFVNLLDTAGQAVLLNGSINDSVTSVVIDNASNLPSYSSGSSEYSVIKIDSEIMIVTNVAGTTLTVERGAFGTNASAHDDNVNILYTLNYNIINFKYALEVTTMTGSSKTEWYVDTEAWSQQSSATSSTGAISFVDLFPEGTKDIRLAGIFIASGGANNSTFKVYDINIIASRDLRSPPDVLYAPNEGLTHNRTDLSGNTITEIHDAHLDCLNRFGGENTKSSLIDGWTNLNSDKNWAIRSWENKPIDLKKKLDQLQYEGGFIFRYKTSNSNPQYIHIRDSYSSSDYTLRKADITDVVVQPTSFSNIISKMNIKYQKHPAKNKYITNQTSTNSTTISKYNIDEKENVKEIKLDAYVSPTIPSSPSSSPNDDFYTYYDNIIGSPKLSISGKIINPKFYNIEVGSIVNFEDRPFDFFNTTDIDESLRWTDTTSHYEDIEDLWDEGGGSSGDDKYFMITSISRTVGILNFKAREIA